MIALSQMSAGWTAFFYVLAVLLGLFATFSARVWPLVNMLAAAFTAFLIPSLWNAISSA